MFSVKTLKKNKQFMKRIKLTQFNPYYLYTLKKIPII